MGQSPSSANYTSNPDDYVLVQGNADLQNGWVYPRVWTTQVTKSAEPGTLIMSVRAPVGAMGKTAYKIVLGRGVAGIQGPEILFQLFKKYESEGYWIKKSTGSTFDSINGDELKNTLVTLPNISPEQTDIENLLIRLDSLITLHQRKLDALKKIKSALLEKMFPKDGSNIPEIRFTGFTEAWEQCKFSDLTDEVIEKTITEDEDILLSCAITGIYTNSEYFSHFRGRSNIGYLKVKRNMLILSAQNLHLGNANVNLKFDHGIISPAYKTFDLKNWNPVFANAWIKRPRANKFWDNATTAGASLCRKNIVWKDLAEQIIYIPAIEKEQRQIGSIFELFDNLITLHQRKLK